MPHNELRRILAACRATLARRVLFCRALTSPEGDTHERTGPDHQPTPTKSPAKSSIWPSHRALPAEHRQAIEPLLSRVIDSNRRRRRILSLVQDALSQLRLDMKYLAFDLEATRRERDEFRRKLEGTA